MSLWPTVPLGEACEINPRSSGAERLSPDAEVSFVPMAAVDELRGCIDGAQTRAVASVAKGYTRFCEGDVLFAKITPCMENGKAAIARDLIGRVGFGSTEFHVLRPRAGLLSEWLLAFIRRPAFREAAKANFTGTAGQRRVPVDFLRQIEMPLPPEPEQRRLLGYLEEAEALQVLGDRADERTQRMCESVYLELFTLNDDYAKWNTVAVEELLAGGKDRIRTGPFGSQLRHSEFGDEGIPVLGIDNVVTNRFRWAKVRRLAPQRFEDFRRFEVFPGDLLITIMGTVGRCCVAPEDLPRCMSTKHLCVLTLERALVEPTYVWGALLFDPELRRQTSGAGGGAVMRGWNSTIIRQLRMRVPPRQLQHAYALRVGEIHGLEESQERRRASLESLRNSLVDSALVGAL